MHGRIRIGTEVHISKSIIKGNFAIFLMKRAAASMG